MDNIHATSIHVCFCAATLFLEFWKRHRASYVCEWKVSDWCEEEVWVFGSEVLTVLTSFIHMWMFIVPGRTDPGNCQQCQLRAQTVQALLSAQHFSFNLCHTNGA